MGNPIDDDLLALTAIVTVAYQLFFFTITYLLRFDKVTDLAGSSNFVLLAVLTLTVGGGYTSRQIVLTSCACAWGLRLGAFLLYRILQWGEDRRFDEQRNNVGRLIVFWTLQALWAWLVCLPMTIVNSKSHTRPLRGLDYAGWSVFGIGLIIESVADMQKLFYKQRPESKGRWTDVGLWKWSRHPNFFGELLVWWGLYMSAVGDLDGAQNVAVIGPVFLTVLLLFVSGIPILERSADQRHGNKQEYVEYKQRTSVLVLVPPMLYEPLPKIVKQTLLFDIGLYNPGPDATQQSLSPVP